MAKVKKAFICSETYEYLKEGDDYTSKTKGRMEQLADNGFIEAVKATKAKSTKAPKEVIDDESTDGTTTTDDSK